MTLDDINGEILTVPEYARVARIGRGTAYANVKAGRVPVVQLSERRVGVPRRALLAMLSGQK